MDVIVDAGPREGTWILVDLLGREMGVIVEDAQQAFFVRPAGNAIATMETMRPGPFHSLDQALAAIETHTRGVCRRIGDSLPLASTGAGDKDGQG
jgi:hypothetical protein